MFLIEKLRKFLSLSATRTRSLRTNFLWNAGGNAIFALSQWGILVVFAKLGDPALVGRVVYGVAITAPLFVVAGLQLRSVQATDATYRYKLGEYLGLRVVTTLTATLVAVVMATVMRSAAGELAVIALLWALSKTVDSGSDSIYGFFQRSERMDFVGVSFALRGLLAVASVAVIFRATHSAPLSLAGLVVAWCAVFILFDIPMARHLLHRGRGADGTPHTIAGTLRPIFDVRKLMPLCFEAAPLGVVAFLLTIQVQIPRYVVAGLLHSHELGLFSAAAYLTFVGYTLVNALGAPASVRLAIYHTTGARSAFRRLMTILLLVAIVLGVAGILVSVFFGGRILTLLYTREYAGMAGVLTMLCVGSAISYVSSFLGCAMTAVRRYKVQVPIMLGVALITLLSAYCLTQSYGLMGTAIGVFLGNVAQLLMYAAVVWQATRLAGRHTAVTKCEAVATAESVQ